ncbi:unnamed protein product [Rotaria sordida]|uniref:Microtubule-associated protein 9 n=1 Tax=Rotaria sordida TaxID=392033 RepID=A0A813V3V7_9BILA|nr:unnamed protein product [Rotaria sordida]CAF3738366.1 unnamed protein product [Rotaria sordida]
MRKTTISDDDDDDDFDRPSPLLQTQRFTKSGTVGTKNFHTIQTKSKHNEGTNLNLNLNGVNDDNDKDSLNDSDDDTSTKTGRSSSSLTTSQSTPKPKERSFLKKDTEKPKVKPRHTGISDDDDDDDDDNERNVFGKTKTEPSPRHQILSLREEEERNQSFMKTFTHEKKRQSPTDIFSTDRISVIQKDRTKFSNDHDNKKRIDSDDENLTNRQSKHKDFIKSRHSSTSSEQSQTQKPSSRSKGIIDQSDNDDDFLKKQSQRQSFKKEKQSSHDSVQDTDSNVIQHQLSSSRPGSASKKEIDSARRSSYCEDQDSVIPSTTTINQKPQSRPTSAKSNTTRQQTQSAIDMVTSANVPPTLDPLTSNNEALAAVLQPPPSPPPRSSARLPPRPKSNLNKTTTIGGINKKQTFKIPSRYQEITSRVDTGRASTSTIDLTRSIERALQKELKSQTLPRPQSARSRKLSATSNHNRSQRRRSSSAYEHVQPRVNTNRSINFDELDTSKLRNDSSQTIKDAVYLEWLKNKEDKRKVEKEELKHWQEEKSKLVDKSTVERKIRQEAQKLERWRQEKEKEIIEKKRIENELKRKQEEQEKQKQKQKIDDAKVGFEDWKIHKEEHLKEQIKERNDKKAEIEQRQEEKQKKVFEAEKAYEKWTNKKKEQTKKFNETHKHVRGDQLKKLRENEETKFLSAQEAYEKWLQDKDKYEIEEKLNTKRRNSLTNKQQQQQVPFLPGGSQKNTGQIRHNVW